MQNQPDTYSYAKSVRYKYAQSLYFYLDRPISQALLSWPLYLHSFIVIGLCRPTIQQAQNTCITFIQRRPFDVGPTLYKCYTIV